jgi:hypothetical protein
LRATVDLIDMESLIPMINPRFRLSPWDADQAAVLEAWGSDRREVLQAGLDAALALMQGEDAASPGDPGPVAPLRGEGDTLATLLGDLLDDLFAQMAVHGPIQEAALDGVLKRDPDGFVAWGYLSPQTGATPTVMFERAGEVEAVTETQGEIRLRVALRRLG